MKRLVVISCVAFAILGVLLLAISRSRIVLLPGEDRRLTESERRERSVTDANGRMSSLVMVDRAELASHDAMRSVLGPLLRDEIGEAVSGQPDSRRKDKLETLIDETVAVLSDRWLQGSGVEYAVSRRGLGYELMTLETMTDRWAVDLAYQRVASKPIPEGADALEVFDAVWSAPPPADSSMFSLVSVCADPDGVELEIGRFCPGGGERWPVLDGELGQAVWAGEGVVGFTMLHSPPGGNWDALRQRGECFDTATVGVVLGFEGEVKIPLRLHYWYDETRNRWWLGQVTASNMPGGFGGVIF